MSIESGEDTIQTQTTQVEGTGTTQIQKVVLLSDEEAEEAEEAQIRVIHWTNVMKKVGKGKAMGKTVKHFLCNYCPKDFQGPSTGTILKKLLCWHLKMANH